MATPSPPQAPPRELWRAPLSRGDSTVSARDATYWLAVASASSSVSARSRAASSPAAPKRVLQLPTSPLRGTDAALGNPLQLAPRAAASEFSGPPSRRASPTLALEEVWENQRYQPVLGWGSRGHLLPLDPGKFMRALRRPRRGGFTSRRRRSVGDAHREDDDGAFDVEWVHSPTFPDVALPDCADDASRWEWISPWHLEFPSERGASQAREQLDADGWQYATSFQHFLVAEKSGGDEGRQQQPPLVSPTWKPKHYVRCRKWVRYRHLRSPALIAAEEETGSSSSSSNSSSSAFDDAFLDSMRGWLRKLGHVRKNWKARYFVLERSVLRYYTDESLARLKGEVLLFHPAARVHYVDIHLSGGRDCAFAVHVGKNYSLLLQAEQLSERESWMYCIEDALLCRDSYYQDGGDGGGESPDQLARRNVRESVALRRKLSFEGMVFSTLGSGRAGTNLVALLGSQTMLRQAVQKTSLVMQLLAECDAFLESPPAKQLTLSFIHTFKLKYGVAPAAAPNDADGGARRRSRGASCADTQQPPLAQAAPDDTPSVTVLQDGRSLLALESYRLFLERSLSTVLSHLTQLPFVTGSPITSPKGWKPAAARGSKQPLPASKTVKVSDDEWQLVRKAALYKLERLTFIPLQEVLYSLLESTICPEDLEDFERNRRHLGAQSQEFFEIPPSYESRSHWKSATALLSTVDNYSLPCEKTAVLLEVARCVYETHASEHAQQTPQMMAADDFLPIFIFILARTSLRNIVVTRHLISETMISALMLGETGYYATMLEAAVGYIASFDIASAVPQPVVTTPISMTPAANAATTPATPAAAVVTP